MFERMKSLFRGIGQLLRNPILIEEYQSALKTVDGYYTKAKEDLSKMNVAYEHTKAELNLQQKMAQAGVSVGQKYIGRDLDLSVMLEHPLDWAGPFNQEAVGAVKIEAFYTDTEGFVDMVKTDAGDIQADRFLSRLSQGKLAVQEDAAQDAADPPHPQLTSSKELTDRMEAAGFAPVSYQGLSDDCIMWEDIKTGRAFGLDGWDTVKDFLDDMEQGKVAGLLIYPSTEVEVFTDPDKFLKEYAQEMDSCGPNGVSARLVSRDPALRKAVDDLIYDQFGVENPNGPEYYQQAQGSALADQSVEMEL